MSPPPLPLLRAYTSYQRARRVAFVWLNIFFSLFFFPFLKYASGKQHVEGKMSERSLLVVSSESLRSVSAEHAFALYALLQL